MPDVSFKVLGVEQVQDALKKFNSAADRELAVSMAKVVDKVAFDAKSLAPVDSGYLRDNITGQILRRRSFIEGRVRSKAPYSVYQEFGTSRHSAHPFMRPAFSKNQKYIEDELGRGLIRAMVSTQLRQGLLRGRLA